MRGSPPCPTRSPCKLLSSDIGNVTVSRHPRLQGYASSKAAGVVRTVMRVPRTGKRAKAKPKYQSKKNKSLKWSGRGVTPVWMREEMKGTKLKKDDFLIK